MKIKKKFVKPRTCNLIQLYFIKIYGFQEKIVPRIPIKISNKDSSHSIFLFSLPPKNLILTLCETSQSGQFSLNSLLMSGILSICFAKCCCRMCRWREGDPWPFVVAVVLAWIPPQRACGYVSSSMTTHPSHICCRLCDAPASTTTFFCVHPSSSSSASFPSPTSNIVRIYRVLCRRQLRLQND